MNFGYAYPLFAAQYPRYNEPLVAVVREARERLSRPVRLVDVGAAIGDTVLLVEQRLGPSALGPSLCVEADSEFLGYLRRNLTDEPHVTVVDALLSRDESGAPDLVRTHAGTASAQGEGRTPTTTLDAVLTRQGLVPDVVKVDTDGFDGAVLAGARDTLMQHHPAVIFEWHPALLARTGNPLLEAFEVLRAAGYDDFTFADRRGDPVQVVDTSQGLSDLARRCIQTGDGDEHFDVTARMSAAGSWGAGTG
jgi:FkbM family methyltransferase